MGNYGVTDPPGSGGAGGPATIIDGVNGAIVATVKDYTNSNPLTVISVDTNGDPVSSGGTTQYAEDTAAVSGEMLAMAGVVRKDVRGTFVDADGDRTELQVNSSGDLRVDGSAVTQPVSAASLPLPTGAATSANQATEITSLANLDVALSTRLKPADTLTAVTTVGTITNVVHVDDNAGSITVDGPLTDAQLRAAPVPVSGTVAVTGVATAANQVTEIASLANLDVALSTRLKPADTLTGVTTVGTVTTITNVVHVDDNAGSLTVDGPLTDVQLRATPVPVSGTVAVTGVATAANQATEIASLASIDTKLTAPLSVSLSSVPLPTGAALESGGNLATMTALLLRMEELIHLTRRHLAMTTGLYTHLVSISSTGISADEILSVELTSH